MTTNVHDFEGMLPLQYCHHTSQKPTQGCQSVMSTLVTSGDHVRPLSNNDAACYDSSSSLAKHPSQKRPAFMFASPWWGK